MLWGRYFTQVRASSQVDAVSGIAIRPPDRPGDIGANQSAPFSRAAASGTSRAQALKSAA